MDYSSTMISYSVLKGQIYFALSFKASYHIFIIEKIILLIIDMRCKTNATKIYHLKALNLRLKLENQ
jgi:hypothetical protein